LKCKKFIVSALALGSLAVSCAQAMEFRRQGEYLVLSGPVVGDDLARMKDAIAAGGISTLVVHNSPGGDLQNGLWLGDLVRKQGWNTVLAGYCASACSLIYLGGVERRYSTAYDFRNTALGIHGAHSVETGQPLHSLTPLIRSHIQSMTRQRFDQTLLDEALNGAYKNDILNIRKPRRLGTASTPPSVFHCKFNQQGDQKDCRPIPNHDVLSLGIVTHENLADLPAGVLN
jgi:hypothetical protein